MKLFIDTANLDEIENALKKGIISGITTNPSIISKEPKSDFLEHIKKIISLVKKYNDSLPISVEVFATKPSEMISQGVEFYEKLNYKNIAIKIPIGWDELEVISDLCKVFKKTCRRDKRSKPGTFEMLNDSGLLDFCLT